ncbi:S-adenosyl-L-methionine-dependent methyltransferase [Ephemerocybe angulata]|uniref:S-adenosyl-L-methionine-dependent methyltransferase n=1 Tax=Ephemerocybe angulata TaxID=980116 RepID=A0A8H6MD75_9AGAR|nr:S-adenosyl-L-methionine-dependent methyltransferase [Tulosesus angulatus]
MSSQHGTRTPNQQFTSNVDLYNGWSATYDIDGNVMPAVDDVIFNDRVVPLLKSTEGDVRVLEIGCGTGRNTIKLRQHLSPGSTIYAVDVSDGMMQQAKKKLEGNSANVNWAILDLQTQGEELAAFVGQPVDIFISTLVLEHIKLDAFFATLGAHLKSGGWAWVSNMHPFIGMHTGAGYKTGKDGVRVRGVSANYEMQEVVDAAKKYGLEVEGDIVEAGVGDDEVEAVRQFGPRAKKCVGWKIFAGFLFKKV